VVSYNLFPLSKQNKKFSSVTQCYFFVLGSEDSTRSKLGAEGACELLISAFMKHVGDPVVSEWCFKAIVSLAALESNRVKFFTSETFECASLALKNHAGNDSRILPMSSIYLICVSS